MKYDEVDLNDIKQIKRAKLNNTSHLIIVYKDASADSFFLQNKEILKTL